MLIPHLHFCGNYEKAIALYEEAFNTKAKEIERAENRIIHASMKVYGQTVFLNDNHNMFGSREVSLNFPVHIIIYFQTTEELPACYEILKDDNIKNSVCENIV